MYNLIYLKYFNIIIFFLNLILFKISLYIKIYLYN